LISFNPKAGSRSRHSQVEAISDILSAAGYRVAVTADLSELAGLAAEGMNKGDLRAAIAVGGDGTASVVRNHVPLPIPLLPVPLGTENLLGRFVGQLTDPTAVCRTLADGVSIGLDLGRANGKHFLLMISVGFDAEVIRALHECRRGNIRRSSYFLPTLQAIRNYAYPQMQVSWGDAEATAEPLVCRWLFGFNLPLYAFGLPIAPDAVATDGQLDLCLFQRGSAWSVLRYLWHVSRGGHHTLADVASIRRRKFRLDGPAATPVAYQLDGDFGGTLPVDVEVFPGELRLLVSCETASRLGFAVA
jgi:diacylglycerol kinase family enzyme